MKSWPIRAMISENNNNMTELLAFIIKFINQPGVIALMRLLAKRFKIPTRIDIWLHVRIGH